MSKLPLNSAGVSLARFSCIYLLSKLLLCLSLVLTFVATPKAAQPPAAPTQLSIGSGTAPVTGTGGIGIIATDSAPNATLSSITSGLVAHWKFDEGSGTTVADSSGNNNHGTLVKGLTWSTGIAGNALNFNGIDDHVTVQSSPSLNLSSAYTLSAWVNPTSKFNDFRTVVAKNGSYFLYASSTIGYCDNSFGPFGYAQIRPLVTVCQPSSLAPNAWTHLALTYNGTTLTLYRNGLAVATASASGNLITTNGTLQIGASQFGEYFKGLIDEVRIHNRALSGTEIQAIYQQDAPSQTVLTATDSFSFSLGNSGDQSIHAGSSVTNTINARLLSGNSEQISFSVSGLPSGATASFSQRACNPTCSSVLNIATTSGTSPGNFPITVTAAGGEMIKTTTFVLTVSLTATSTISSVSAAAGPASFYVAKHGSDSYSCAQAANPSTPKLTIGAALNCVGFSAGAGANKVVEVAAGTYTEPIGGPFPRGSSWSAPFTLRAKQGDTVIIRPNSGGFAMFVHDNDSFSPWYFIIQGLTFDGTNLNSGNVAIFASFVRMVGNEVINTAGCVAVFGGTPERPGFEFIDNKIYGGTFFHGCDAGGGGSYGYPIYWGGHDALFERNELYDFPSFGFHIYRSTGCPSGNIVRNNKVHSFGWAANCPGSGDPRCAGRGPDDRGAAILACGNGHQIYNNIVYNGVYGIHLYTGRNKQVYNNTVFNMWRGGILSDNSDGNIVQENIVYNATAPTERDIFSWQSPDTTTYRSNLCARSGAGCSLVVNPLFVDAANGNFNLQSGSPAAGIGAAP